MEKEISIALIGNPNVGKTSLFNALTGSRQHVGNWPGVTIEKKTGSCSHNGFLIKVTDLPGTYSLSARSPDEAVANDFIMNGHPDLVVQVIDSTNLERNLYLTTQLLDMGLKVLLALNMSDMADGRGDVLDIKRFSAAWGVPAVRTSATQKKGIEDLLDAIIETFRAQNVPRPAVDLGADIEKRSADLQKIMNDDQLDTPSLRWLSLRLIEGAEELDFVKNEVTHRRMETLLNGVDREEMEMTFVDKRYETIAAKLDKVYRRGAQRRSLTDSMDRVITNKYFAIPIFLVLMWGLFQLTFVVASPFATLIDASFASMAEWTAANVQPDWLASLIGDGIIGGVGFVLVFLPNILVMFLMISLLEDSGYLARAAFIMDRLMSKMGLHGKSFIPMLIGLGCNVPAVMATRTIEDRKSRIITILTTPYISCAARLPVYILFAGVFFPRDAGTVVFGLYLLGIVVAIFSALLFRKTMLKSEATPFIMELPPYRLPMLKGTLVHMWDRGSTYVRKAGTIILLGAVIVWALASLPWGVEYGSEVSYAGALGHVLEPLVAPLGFDWRIAVALIFGFVAKEIVVGSLGVLYGAEDEGSLKEALAGPEGITAPAALGLMTFVLLYTPCLAVLGVIWKETGSWRWTMFSVAYSLVLAFIVAFITFQIGSMIW